MALPPPPPTPITLITATVSSSAILKGMILSQEKFPINFP
jgi:hypothetical protein